MREWLRDFSHHQRRGPTRSQNGKEFQTQRHVQKGPLMTYSDYLLKRKKLAEDRKAAPLPPPPNSSESEPTPAPRPRATSPLTIRSESPPVADLHSQSVGLNARALPAPPRQQRSSTPSRGGAPQRPPSLPPSDQEGPEQRVALLDASFSYEGGEAATDSRLPSWQPPPAFLLLEGKETSLGLGTGFGSFSRSPPRQGHLAVGPGSPTLLRCAAPSRPSRAVVPSWELHASCCAADSISTACTLNLASSV